MRSLGTRLVGLVLIILGVAPAILIAGGVILCAILVADLVQSAGRQVEAVSAIVTDRVVPQLQRVEATYASVARQTGLMKDEFEKAMLAATQVEDIQIAAGQLGSTAPLRLRIPERSMSLASGAVRLGEGALFNETVPGVPIPQSPVVLPMTPVRTAFAPFVPDGPVDQAARQVQRELEAATDEVTRLRQPLADIGSAVMGSLAPLGEAATTIAMIGLGVLAAFAALLAIRVALGIHLVTRRRTEAGMVYRTGGSLGFLRYLHHDLLLQGASRLFGSPPPSSQERLIADLQDTVDRLESELAALRAQLEGGSLRTAAE
jgi:hypothetical protein